MLPLVSIITTVVIGTGLFSKTVIFTGFRLSRISKSSSTRSGTRRFSLSVTVT